MSDKPVQVTADALISLRTGSPLARTLKLDCPHDRLFATEAGQRLADMALSLDPVYEQYNMVRYAWFADRMRAAAERVSQLVILGVGFDTRALTLPPLAAGACNIFEVDFPDLLAEKRAILHRAGVAMPDHIRSVPMDLTNGNRAARLAAAGFRTDEPAAVFMEGVSFFLPAAVADGLLDPAALGLAAGSSLTFDCWTAHRARTLNRLVQEKIGRPLFGDSPFGETAADIYALLQGRGYRVAALQTLGALSEAYGVNEIADPLGESWFVVEATLD